MVVGIYWKDHNDPNIIEGERLSIHLNGETDRWEIRDGREKRLVAVADAADVEKVQRIRTSHWGSGQNRHTRHS